jgi:hypothetical protein
MRRSLLLSAFVVCLSCSRPIPELTDINLDQWKNDFKGCKGLRSPFTESLRSQKDKLKGLSERDLVALLGRPDRNDLSEHHGKSYQYFIAPGPGCEGVDSVGLSLTVRFNATGVSREVAIE